MFFPYFPIRLESSHQQIVAHFNTMEYPRGPRDPLRAKSLSTGLVLDHEPTGSPACRLPVTPRLDAQTATISKPRTGGAVNERNHGLRRTAGSSIAILCLGLFATP